MKTLGFATLVYIAIAFASFIPESQVVLNDLSNGPRLPSQHAQSTLKHASENIPTGQAFVQHDGIFYELVRHPEFPDHQLRITEPSLCDPSVKQYSGYLDITDDKHLFFWFFESRNSPQDAPVILWLNGGPGCSSSTGLLFELGPCSIADGGKNATFNPYSWNTHANIIFLDQPINVGFSYAEDGSKVETSQLAGKDVYTFLELFLNRFPEYSKQPFHLAAESYGGTYAPHIASTIHEENQKVPLTSNNLVKINLASVVIGNGLTDSYTQFASIPDYLCEGPYPIFDDPDGPECASLRAKVPTCQRLIKACHDFKSRLICVPAELYCNVQLLGPVQSSGLNPYDARRACNPDEDGPLCYKQMGWIETYMNDPKVKAALGVSPQRQFSSCNMGVNQGFLKQGDAVQDTPALIPELVENGIRFLIYAGVADMMCNYMGNERWLEVLPTKFLDEFLDAPTEIWTTAHSNKPVGTVRSAGGDGTRAGNITFVAVHEAGHMVPYDQPEAALDLISRWIFDLPLTTDASLDHL
ncbi:Alpha/Beta hydrolase protein [Scleroderma yunnanense]